MVQAAAARRADVHAGALADVLQAFERGYGTCIVRIGRSCQNAALPAVVGRSTRPRPYRRVLRPEAPRSVGQSPLSRCVQSTRSGYLRGSYRRAVRLVMKPKN